MLQETLVVFFDVWSHLDRVNSGATTFGLDVGRETEGLSATTGVGAFVTAVDKLWLLRVVAAVEEFAADEVGLTHCALESDQPRPDLPVDVFPLHLLLTVHELNEAIQVEEPVSHVLCYHLSMEVYEDLGIGTLHPLVLLGCIQLTAVNASVKDSHTTLSGAFRSVNQTL